jgi:hypothetical protein
LNLWLILGAGGVALPSWRAGRRAALDELGRALDRDPAAGDVVAFAGLTAPVPPAVAALVEADLADA